jgi:hypothetical protein
MHVHGPALWVVSFLLGFAALVIYSAIWVYRDAQRRNRSGLVALLFIFCTGWPASYIWWFWLRPRETESPRRSY